MPIFLAITATGRYATVLSGKLVNCGMIGTRLVCAWQSTEGGLRPTRLVNPGHPQRAIGANARRRRSSRPWGWRPSLAKQCRPLRSRVPRRPWAPRTFRGPGRRRVAAYERFRGTALVPPEQTKPARQRAQLENVSTQIQLSFRNTRLLTHTPGGSADGTACALCLYNSCGRRA